MPTPAPSLEDYVNIGKAEAAITRPDLALHEGDVAEMDMVIGGSMADRLTGYAAVEFKKTFLDGASGDDLTERVDDRYQIQRKAATPATATVTFERPTDTAGGGVLAAGFVVATQRDANGREIRYTLDDDVTFGGSDLSKTGTVTSESTGSGTRAEAGKINRMVSTAFDSSITVTNVARTVGGDEKESDDELRARARAQRLALARGTLPALEFGALQVEGVRNATAIEDDNGIATVYVTDGSGGSSPQMVADVIDELDPEWQAHGGIVNVEGGELYLLTPIQVALTVRTGVAIAELVSKVKSAIVVRLAKLKIGETATRDMIKAAAIGVAPDQITAANVVAPAADVQPDPHQLIRTEASEITVG